MDHQRESSEKKQVEVILVIPGEEPHSRDPNRKSCEDPSKSESKPNSPAPEIALKSSPSPGKPPKPPQSEALLIRRSIPIPAFSKPKSRFVELTVPPLVTTTILQDSLGSPHVSSPNRKSSSTPKALKDEEEDDNEDEEEIFKREQLSDTPVRRRRRFTVRNFIEWLILVSSISVLVMSLKIHRLQAYVIWGLEIWKWCLMVAVICCGRLVTQWIITILVFLIERNFLLKKKVLYFVYALKNSVRVFIWLSLVSLSWFLLFNPGVHRSPKTVKVLEHVSQLLISFLIGSVIWLVKTLLVKILTSSFHMNRFFDRIQESIFHQYVLQTLSGPPLMELAENVGPVKSLGQLSFRSKGKGKEGEKQEVIDVAKLYKLRQEKVSAWTMKGLVHVIRTSRLSTHSNTLDENFIERDQRDMEITNEWEAKAAAYRIFKNVAKPGSSFP